MEWSSSGFFFFHLLVFKLKFLSKTGNGSWNHHLNRRRTRTYSRVYSIYNQNICCFVENMFNKILLEKEVWLWHHNSISEFRDNDFLKDVFCFSFVFDLFEFFFFFTWFCCCRYLRWYLTYLIFLFYLNLPNKLYFAYIFVIFTGNHKVFVTFFYCRLVRLLKTNNLISKINKLE